MTIENLFVDGDRMVVRWTYSGTHQGTFMGLPPTGKLVRLPGIHIDQLTNSEHVEHWVGTDGAGLVQQLRGGDTAG